MQTWLFMTGAAVALWVVKSYWPVKQLKLLDRRILQGQADKPVNMVMLDVRDAVDYQNGHVDGSINISIGRLPVLWKKELLPDDPVLILSDSRYQRLKAARILQRRGFNRLYAIRDDRCA